MSMENIKSYRIEKMNHPLFEAFSALYERAFPRHEKRTAAHQATALQSEHYHLLAFCRDEVLIGFIALWHFGSYQYVEHYAINDQLRGQGYGSLLLQQVLDNSAMPTILEIDPVVDDISTKRLRFYRAIGFQSNEYPHVHPTYHDDLNGHPLMVLSSGRTLQQEEYERFRQDLDNIVMVF